MKYFKLLFKLLKLFIIIIILSSIGCFIYVKTSPKIIINSANNIVLYDKDNNSFFKGSESKEWVDLNNISDYLIKATINTEDKNFYRHFGFDFLRIGKALYTNIINKNNQQGASTITQQYAKNLFLDFDKTWKRKWDEMWYTMRIEANYSKDEILEGYLNTINYGHGKYGVENASKYYFGKSAKELDLAEATILASIPKAPSNYSPFIDYDTCKKRQLLILNNLVKNNIITEEDKDKAYDEEIKLVGKENEDVLSSINYYQDAVLDELKSISTVPSNYSKINGLKIYTTLDYNAQSILEKNIKESFPSESTLEVASVIMNPNTGGIIALIGGRDYNKSTFNRATDSKRQVGSTMKPYLYYAALENGFTASSQFTSEPTSFPLENNKVYTPKNYNEKYGNKPISMATAIAYSENIYAVKTHMFLGYDSLINVAKRVGIKEKLDSVASLPLGTNEINIINMTAGYAAFANTGYKIKPHFITKVVDGNGNTLYKYSEEKELVLNPSLVFILNNILTATYDPLYIDYNYPTAISLSGKLNHKYALKSGTTSGDNWNIGFNKDLVCSVWVGYDNNNELVKSDYKYAQNIWSKTVEELEKDKENTWYKKPSNVVGLLVEPITGKVSLDKNKNTKLIYFLKGTEPQDTDPTFDEINAKSKES
ncbi:MAG: PBP1A family penicillin-binding protein [Bacilli bacterium]|nr:PBP1A family penicillin-binding protein [Bacilli bacterium]MBQ6404664.1 PBP1A family penicillin-binding protein [Bacilli bacterium]